MIEDHVVISHEKTYDEMFAMEDWLKANLGLPALFRDQVVDGIGRRWCTDRMSDHFVFYFATKEDAMWFKMAFNYVL